METLNSLDPANMGEWPMFAKLLTATAVLVLTAVLGWVLFIAGVKTQISEARSQEETLLVAYKELDSKQRTFKQHKEKMLAMEKEFDQLLQKLPKDINIPNLVEEVNTAGLRAGVRFQSILVKPEEVQESTIELPIEIIAVGDYHGFGVFVGELANLPRIITLHDYTITTENSSAEAAKKQAVPKLKLTLKAKTYRYNDKAADTKAANTGAQPQ